MKPYTMFVGLLARPWVIASFTPTAEESRGTFALDVSSDRTADQVAADLGEWLLREGCPEEDVVPMIREFGRAIHEAMTGQNKP